MSPRRNSGKSKAAAKELKAPNGRTFGPVETEGKMAGYRLTERSPGHTRYALAPDGTVLQIKPKKPAPPPKRERVMPRTDEQMVRMILQLPETYRCYDHATAEYQQRLDGIVAAQRGRPRAYPDALFSAIQAIRKHLGGTVEAACAKITNHPDLVELIWAGVEQHSRYPLTPTQQASCDARSFPDRATVLRTIKHRWTPEVHEQALTNTSVPIAVETDHFTDGDVDDEHMHLHTDGTVLRSPTKARTPTAVDPRTGEIYPQR